MKRLYKSIIFPMLLLLFSLNSCKDDQVTSGFQDLKYYKVTSTISNVNLNNIGEVQMTDLGSNGIPIEIFPSGSQVEFSTSEPWCKAELFKSNNINYVKISASLNLGAQRTAQVRAMTGTGADKSGVIFYVQQAAALTITPNNVLAKANSGIYPLDLKASGTWTVTSDAGWCTADMASGNGDAVVKITVASNILVQPRIAILKFTLGEYSTSFTVTQSANVPFDKMIDMVFIEGGSFTMGCTAEQVSACADNEKIAHSVTVSGFYLGTLEVTQELWRTVMGEDHPTLFKGDKLPVEMVSWDDAQLFIKRLNDQTGKKYRLPTEAEWEYAARGGKKSKGYVYSGGNNAALLSWYNTNSGAMTQEVGTKSPNELGLYDMSGNLYEWVSDWYEASFKADAATNPTGPATGDKKVLKGGSYKNAVSNVRVSKRASEPANKRSDNIGFRVALSAN